MGLVGRSRSHTCHCLWLSDSPSSSLSSQDAQGTPRNLGGLPAGCVQLPKRVKDNGAPLCPDPSPKEELGRRARWRQRVPLTLHLVRCPESFLLPAAGVCQQCPPTPMMSHVTAGDRSLYKVSKLGAATHQLGSLDKTFLLASVSSTLREDKGGHFLPSAL